MPALPRTPLLLLLARAATGARINSLAALEAGGSLGGSVAGELDTSLVEEGDVELDLSLEEVIGGKDCKFPPELSTDYPEIKLLGEGMRGCAYLADDKAHGKQVVVKVAKYDHALKNWKYECEQQMQAIHKSACAAGKASIELAEQYLPTCLKVGASSDGQAYLVMQKANTDELKQVKKLLFTVDEAKSAFAQVVAGLYTMHSLGYTHNDFHDKNVMVSREEGAIRVSIIDFGRTKETERAEIKNNFHRDANSLLKHLSKLSGCKVDPKNLDKGKTCLAHKWGADQEFLAAVQAVANGNRDQTREQHVQELFHTTFVQNVLPRKMSYFPSHCR